MELELPCLKNFITFQSVNTGESYVPPTSKLHIEALPGVHRKSVSKIEPGKYANAQEFLDDKLNIAGLMILDRMRNYLEPYVQERGTKEAGTIGTWSDDAALSGVAQPRGVRIKVQGGPLLVPLMSRVWIKSSQSTTGLQVKVKDGQQETTYSVDTVAGEEVELWIHLEARTKQVDVTITDVRFHPHTGSTKGTKYFSTCSTCAGHGLYQGIAGSGLLNGSETDALQGIRAEVVLMCSIDPVACILLKRYRFAVLYQTGILILQEWDASDRTNYFTLHSKEWAQTQAEQWNMVDLPRHMKTANEHLVAFIRNLDPSCLTCGNGPNYASAHG